MLVTPHERYHGNRASRPMMRVSMSMQELEARYQQYLEAQKGAVVPQEETPNVSEHTPQ
jgi:hypothetical protein